MNLLIAIFDGIVGFVRRNPLFCLLIFLLALFAPSVLGGIAMSGGRGKCVGILFGVMSYTVIDKIIVAPKMNTLLNDTVKGTILIVAIIVQTMAPVIREHIQARRRRRLS